MRSFRRPQIYKSWHRKSSFSKNHLIIYDRRLKHLLPLKEFAASYAVKAGEELKSLEAFPEKMKEISKACSGLSLRETKIVAVGGGSVGDFAGFVASILHRGVGLVQVPSTWLAAIDSAHGGKTALNLEGAKNQVGTFYQAQEIFLIKDLLMGQPAARAKEANAELIKIALIDGTLWTSLQKKKSLSANALWQLLPSAIEAKYKVVQKDPLECRGERQILNLGHTLGHVIEAYHGLPHGEAVAHGLLFALQWSCQRKYLSQKTNAEVSEKVRALTGVKNLKPIPKKSFEKLLLKDKKRSSKDQLTFIFLEGIGKASRKKVSFEQMLREATRQGWVK